MNLLRPKHTKRLLTVTSAVLVLTTPLTITEAAAKHGFPGGPGRPSIIHVGPQAYFFMDGLFYRHGPRGYIVAPAPLGAKITVLPPAAVLVTIDGAPYYTCSGVFYKQTPGGYIVVSQPVKQLGPDVAIGQNLQTTVELLNVRSGPGLNHHVITQIHLNEVVHVEALSADWCLVRLKDNTTGWIKTMYTAVIDTGAKG